ncbi:MAG: pantetheine-phosphate adenylyltransferase [Sulfurovum sp.]|nr:pantetheine-phosphate adenylyltransferase [Sulfurovaceae bacterium]
MKNRAIYSGTFDPITNGHLDIINRACKLFDEVVIAVAKSSNKQPMFSLTKRIEMVESVTSNNTKIRVIGFKTLLVDLANKLNINFIIRGLRAISDFEYELQMGYANASLKDDLETIYLMPSLEQAFISSTVVRSIFHFDGKIDHLVPKEVYYIMKKGN